MLSMSRLSYEQQPTGVVYGFLRQIQNLADRFHNPEFIFAWDSERSYRKEIYPEYKRKPKSKDFDVQLAEALLIGKPQFREIRCNILPRLGFKNIFLQTGIEADDIIAKVINQYWNNLDKIVIVSADNDLYQLLYPDVMMFDPKEKTTYTGNDFVKEYKIAPDIWYKIKAIAGCSSDNVKGVTGIGKIKALQYINGELKGKKNKEIEEFILSGKYDFNVSLVKLPYVSTRSLIMMKDKFDIKEFEGICLDHGFHSLLSKESYKKWREILK
jgi:5'-3' exonuclease